MTSTERATMPRRITYEFTDAAVQRLMARADDGVIADVDELVALIRSVRDLFGPDPTGADADAAWLFATQRYEKSFGMPHRFLNEPTMRKLFGAILVDVLRGIKTVSLPPSSEQQTK
jgi:hypothetical protein